MAFRKRIHWTVKQEIWALPCAICGDTENVQIDHIVPVSKGGTNDRQNLQPLCRYCNTKKGNR